MSCPDKEQDEDVLDCPSLPALASQWYRLRTGKRGRVVKATQAIPTAGTTVLQDQPYAAVVSDIYRNVCCAACLHVCTTQIFVCGGCSVTFYCSSECVARDGALVHTGTECQALKKLAAMDVEGDSQAMRLALRLACLTKKKDAVAESSTAPSPPAFHSSTFIRSLEDHYDDAMQDHAVRQGILAVAEALASFLNSSSSSSSSSSASTTTTRHEIASLLLIIQCNAHGVRDSSGRMLGLGLFPLASMLNHSCLPSCHHVFSLHPGQGLPTLVFKTLRAVKEGEELVYSYTDLMRPGGRRREILERAYFFKCACARCLITLAREGEGGREREAAIESKSSVADALTEWALQSPACDSPGCAGAWCPLKEEGKEGEEGSNGDDEEEGDGASKSMSWMCLGCGKQEEAAEVQIKLTVGTTLLHARLQALQEEQQQQQQEGDAAPQAPLLSDAGRSLATHLFGNDPPLGLHVRHWLVYHALASLSRHLMPMAASLHAGEKEKEGGKEEEVAWLRAACEVWALRNLWRLSGGVKGGREGGKEVSHHPELGEQLVAVGKALQAYEAATGGTKKFEEEKECGAWTLPPIGKEEDGDVIGRGPQALRLGQEILGGGDV